MMTVETDEPAGKPVDEPDGKPAGKPDGEPDGEPGEESEEERDEETVAESDDEPGTEPAGEEPDEKADGTAEPTEPGTAAGRRRRRDVVLVIGATLVLLAGLFAWWQGSRHDADLVAAAETRDAALIAATRHIETMNTLDYREVDAGLQRWQQVTTGTLHDQLANVSAEDRKLLADQRKISVGKVVDAAVLDIDDDTARVLAAVEVTVRGDGSEEAEPTVKRNRYSAELAKVDGKWLLESLEQVAVNLS